MGQSVAHAMKIARLAQGVLPSACPATILLLHTFSRINATIAAPIPTTMRTPLSFALNVLFLAKLATISLQQPASHVFHPTLSSGLIANLSVLINTIPMGHYAMLVSLPA